MTISQKVGGMLEQASWIRKMFEEGTRLKKEFGDENVFDLSLGNPVIEPPTKLISALVLAAQDETPGLHRYMPNAGLEEARMAIARSISPESGVQLTASDTVMTCGAAGALNITLKSLLDPGDEVIIFAPYFVEYLFYADNHGGKAVSVNTKDDFTIDPAALEQAITPRTKAVIINSPNNPTGIVYSRESLQAVADVLKKASEKRGNAIYLISDDPYKKIIFDGVETPHLFEFYKDSIYISSHSKDLAVPGERIGFVVVHPECSDRNKLMAALIFCNRVLGFVNAPALIQRAIAKSQDVGIDPMIYQKKRDRLYSALVEIGYSVVKPQGAFYFFPKSPLEDEVEFCRMLTQEKTLAVPGRGFGTPGYFRLSYCLPDNVIEGAIIGLKAAFEKATA
jgi:aspartate aminotransferase